MLECEKILARETKRLDSEHKEIEVNKTYSKATDNLNGVSALPKVQTLVLSNQASRN